MRSILPLLAVAAAGCGVVVAQAPATHKPAGTATHAAAVSTDPVVISAGTETIRASQFAELIKQAPPENQAQMNADKRAVADDLGKMMALAAEARRQGLDQDPAFKAEMLIARDNGLAKLVVDKLQASAAPTDAQIQAYYTAHAAQFRQTKVKHILVGDNETQGGPSTRTQAEALTKANDLETQLKAGGDFAALAKANSDDPGSKDKGGELGEITPGETVPEFDNAIATLPIGQVSQPVHSRFGYHIIVVEARDTVPLEQAKAQITQQLTNDNMNAAIDKIAATEHMVISNSYFGPAKPSAPQPPAGH